MSTGAPVAPEQLQGMKDFFEIYERHYGELQEKTLAAAQKLPDLAAVVRRMTKEQLAEAQRVGLETMRKAIVEGDFGPLLTSQRTQAQLYANLGVRFGEWFELVSDLDSHIIPLLVTAYAAQPARLTRAVLGLSRYTDMGLAAMGEAYLEAKERRIAEQRNEIHELSTPVLQVRDRMLLLPVIGILDTARARMLTQNLLTRVRAARAKVVVIDITGVPAVDSKVANHLLQTVAAVRLMGATSVVTGLSTEVAQALVVLGVDLRDLITIGDLQEGLEEADRLMHHGTRKPATSEEEEELR
jgi:rsbT co-antagonist protein RsbR